MSNRTAKFVSAIFASFLAGAPLTTASHGARAAGDCLAGPKGTAAEGSHWYYRIERATQRHCWYTRSEDKPAQNAAPIASSARPVSVKTDAAMQPSVANARAELPMLQTRPGPKNLERETPASLTPRSDSTAAGDASLVASRWPGQSDASVVARPQPTPAVTAASVPSTATPAAAPAVASAVALAAAESSPKRSFGSLQFLTVIMGALSLATVMGSAIFKFGSTRSTGQPGIQGHRRVNWGTADRIGDPRAADDPNRRIEQMLARLSRNQAA